MSQNLFKDPPVLPRGHYRHYKGGEYDVIDLARHSESFEWIVVYRPRYGEGGLWVRPYTMFIESVVHEGREQARFAFLG
jgi:hypothetical protein